MFQGPILHTHISILIKPTGVTKTKYKLSVVSTGHCLISAGSCLLCHCFVHFAIFWFEILLALESESVDFWSLGWRYIPLKRIRLFDRFCEAPVGTTKKDTFLTWSFTRSHGKSDPVRTLVINSQGRYLLPLPNYQGWNNKVSTSGRGRVLLSDSFP